MMLSGLARTLLSSIVALVLVFFNACFVAAEFSFVKVRKSRLQELALGGDPKARTALACVNNLPSTLSSTQLGTTLTSLALGWIGEGLFSSAVRVRAPAIYHPSTAAQALVASVLSFCVIALLHAVLGELVPKSIGIQNSERMALLLARPLRIFFAVSRPLTWFFSHLSGAILRLIGYGNLEEVPLSEQELKLLLQESREDGIISRGEAQIMGRAFVFADKQAKDIMVPAAQVDFLCIHRPIQQSVETLITRRHARFPLCDGTFEKVVGIVCVKDVWPELFDVWPNLLKDLTSEPFQNRYRPAHFVSDQMRQDHLLRFFQDSHVRMAIVRNSAGSNIGIVTLENILEQLVGDCHMG
jgi:CBS domain containing-hemolysin-like protein